MSLKYCTKKKGKKLCIKHHKDIDLLSDTTNKNYNSYWRGNDRIASKSFIYIVNHPDVKDNVCYAMTVSPNTDRFEKYGALYEDFSITFDIEENKIIFPRLVNNGWLDYDELPDKYPDFKIPTDVRKKNEEFLFYLIRKCKKRFFALPVSILFKKNKGHSGIILYDTVNKEMEYFEPYGDVHQILLEKKKPRMSERLVKIELSFLEYCKKHLGEFKYFPTLSFCPIASFQTQNNTFGLRKEGENYKYCMVWSLWYLHLRLKNIKLDRTTLIKKALEELDKDKQGYRIFIRNYSQFLLKNIDPDESKKQCPSGKVLNEKTNRCINKPKTKKLRIVNSKKECPEGKVLNEKTNRCITKPKKKKLRIINKKK